LLLDGCQASALDIGGCGSGSAEFVQRGLAFVRERLLPALAQPDTCSILALKPMALS